MLRTGNVDWLVSKVVEDPITNEKAGVEAVSTRYPLVAPGNPHAIVKVPVVTPITWGAIGGVPAWAGVAQNPASVVSKPSPISRSLIRIRNAHQIGLGVVV